MKPNTDGIKLTSLRDCFMFLYWLHKGGGRNKLGEVAQTMHGRIGDYCKSQQVTKEQIESHLSSFLGHVSTFYEMLVREDFPQEALASGASMPPNPSADDIFTALLECLPKFLAAIYYLWYCVSHTFESLGGGGWKDDCPGWEKGRWYGLRNNWGGDLQAYLRSSDTNEYRVIPSSFNKDEVRDGWSYSGYSRGYSMVTPLKKIFEKKDDTAQNVFRDVFATSVLTTTSGTQISNTANALALVNLFCEIVVEEDENGNDWLRSNLDKVRGNLEKIQQFESEHDDHAHEFASLPKHHNMLQEYYAELGPHFTKNLFPYGFTFYGEKEYLRENAPYEDLRKEWDGAIFELKREGGGLAELKSILDGKGCTAPRPPPKPRPRPAPAPRPPRPARPAPPPQPSRASGGRTIGPRLLGDWSYVGSRASGARGGSERGKGPHSRGGGSGARSDRGRGPGPRGRPNARGTQVSTSTGRTMSTQPRLLQHQNNPQPHSQHPLPAAPSALRGPSPPAEIHPTSEPLVSPAPTHDHSSVSSSSSSSSSVTDVGGTGLGPQAAASGHSQRSGKNLALNRDSNPGIPGQHSDLGVSAGEGGAPSTGGHSKDTVSTASKPVATLSIDLPQVQSSPRDVQSAGHKSDPGRTGSSSPQANSSHDGAPGSIGTPVGPVPDPDSMVASVIHPALSSNARQAQNSNVQSPDSLSSRDHLSDDAQNLKDQAHSSNPTQKHPQGPQQKLTSGATTTSAVSRAGPGVGGGSGGGGGSAGGTDGDSQVDIHSGKPSHTSQLSVQPHAPTLSAPGSLSSDITGPPGDMGLTLQSPPQVNPQGQTGDASGHSPAAIPQPDVPDSPGDSDAAVTRAQQRVDTRDNGPPGQPGPTPSVPPSPPSAPPPTTAAEPSTPQSTPHGLMKSQDLHDPGAMQTLDPSLKGDADSSGPLNQQVASSPTVSHDPAGKSTSGSPHLTSGTPTISQHDAVHGAVLTQPSSVSGSRPSSIAVSPSGGGQNADDHASLSDPALPHAKLSMGIPRTHPMTSPGLPLGQEIGGAAGSGSPGATIGDPNLQNRQTTDNNLGSSGTSMNSGSNASREIPPKTPMPDPAEFQLEIDKLYTPDMIYGADKIQGEALPAAEHKKIVSPYDTYSNIPTQAPLRDKFYPENLEFLTEDLCLPSWITQTPKDSFADVPVTELFPSEVPCTVRDMLRWLVGIRNPKHLDIMKRCIEKVFRGVTDVIHGEVKLSVNGSHITADNVIDTIHLAAVFAASVLSTIEPAWKGNTTLSATLKRKDSGKPQDPDCCALLCQLRDYVYACCHQLAFLRSQCSRVCQQGGWQDCPYGRDIKTPSPLQAFLIDAPDSKFETHPFDPCNICLQSRVKMGFTKEDFSKDSKDGKHISTILTPSCGGDDPQLTLSSYLNCLTRRTPRTTGEIVSFFHNFGNELHDVSSSFSSLGSALSSQHDDCPGWDCLKEADLHAVQDLRGSAPPTANHDKDHPKTLSTLLGCGIDNAKCSQLLSPITHRAYSLYSSTFVHHYLSWTVYLPDRLWESLLKLQDDLENLQCHDSDSKLKPLHQCDKALPLLYSHGFTPPEAKSQPSLTCSELITKLEEVVAGEPIAGLVTAMDLFLYRIRAPFLFTLVTLWLIARLYIAHSLLYRMDVLLIRSHLLTTRASHLIDVKALLAGSRRMLSLYKDVDYFDDDLD
ncbi:ribosome binding protein [Babesia ovata]|uniref:Ribosome binding protein n=1 Tax=Babesia ovata TaxID=189622 RepID=A0A2H6K8X5_9APIC|nr:ribosome binding protein [Babesia ovata]GBE59428.1 ribosome binding protein [Babesia ovata]